MALWRLSLPRLWTPHSPPDVSHSDDKRHSKLLFIHRLGERIHKSMADC